MTDLRLRLLSAYIAQEVQTRDYVVMRTDTIRRNGRSAALVLVRSGQYEARFYGQALVRPVSEQAQKVMYGCLALSEDFQQSEVITGAVPDWCAYFVMASVHFGGLDE